MDPGSVSSQNSGINSFVVSRPDHVSHASSGQVSQLPVRPADPPVNVNGHTAVTAPVASTVAAPAPAASSSNFANFADFDTAAFDSLPPGTCTCFEIILVIGNVYFLGKLQKIFVNCCQYGLNLQICSLVTANFTLILKN